MFAESCVAARGLVSDMNSAVAQFNAQVQGEQDQIVGQVRDALGALQLREYNKQLVSAFLERLGQLLAREAAGVGLAINDRGAYLARLAQLVERYVRPALDAATARVERDLRLRAYAGLQEHVYRSKAVTRERFTAICGLMCDTTPDLRAAGGLTELAALCAERAEAAGLADEEKSCGIVVGVLWRLGMQVDYEEIMA